MVLLGGLGKLFNKCVILGMISVFVTIKFCNSKIVLNSLNCKTLMYHFPTIILPAVVNDLLDQRDIIRLIS